MISLACIPAFLHVTDGCPKFCSYLRNGKLGFKPPSPSRVLGKKVILHALNRAELTQKLTHQQSFFIDILLLNPYCWLIPLNPLNLRCFLKAERRSTKWFWLMKLDSLKEGFGFTEWFLVRRSLQTGFGDILACLLLKFPGYLSHNHLVRRFQPVCSGGLGLSTLWNRQQRRRYSSSTENKKPTVLLGKKHLVFLKQ